MRQWPELALVCEFIPDDINDIDTNGVANSEMSGGRSKEITPLRQYLRRVRKGAPPHGTRPQKEIVGYILGKVEDRPILHPPSDSRRSPSKVVPLYQTPSTSYVNGQQRWDRPSSTPKWEKTGHVTSLAVHSHARRLGIASSLLRQLHYHLAECYSAQCCGLHVRISNAAAVKLYVETLDYDVADIIPQYYGDGEDAYFMKKELNSWAELNGQKTGGDQLLQRGVQQQSLGGAIPDWVNRDSRSSFFDDRSSIRDMMSPEEKAWVDTNNGGSRSLHGSNTPSLTGKVTKSFRTLLNGGESQSQQTRRFTHKNFRRNESWQVRPPWETGPEELRLPRYRKIDRPTSLATVSDEENNEQRQSFINEGEASAVVDGFEEAVTASGTC